MKKFTVSDITLRVAKEQQSILTFREMLDVAEKLNIVRVDAIELPAIDNLKESEVISRTIATATKDVTIKIPVGDNEESVKTSAECIGGANRQCLQVILPVSTAQMEYFYHVKAPAMQEKIGQLVKCAKNYCENVEFVAKDAFRAEPSFIESCILTAVQSGATEITVTDETGEAFPEDYENLIKKIKSICNVKVLVQPLDTLSLAVACAISAIKAGADGVKTSAIGKQLSLGVFGELVRAKRYDLEVECELDITKTNSISNEITNNKNQTVVLGDKTSSSVIERTASAKDIIEIVKQLGYELSDTDNGKVYDEFKKLTVKKETVDTKELEAIIASTAMQVPSTYHLISYFVNSSNAIPATANITLEKNGEKITGVSTGDGPIDAAFHAIEQVIGHHYELDDFQVHAVTKGRGAVGSSIIRLRADGKLYSGNGVSTDIVGACIRAYINALNKIVYEGD